MSKKEERLTDAQKRQFRQLFRIALNGHAGSCHGLCCHGSAAPYNHLRAVLTGKEPEGEATEPAIQTAVKLCSEHNIPLGSKNSAGENPVFFVSGRCFACYLYLVEQGLKPTVKNTWGVTTLNQACQLLIETGDARILQHLLVNKYYPVDIGDDSDQTLLHQAAKNNSAPVIHFLLEMGANINHRDTHNKTPLFIACQKACFQAAHALIKSGAKHKGGYSMDERKETLLHAAARSSVASKKLLKMLIWHDIPLAYDGCCCKPTKKQFCKRISPHMKDYLHEKCVEYQQKKAKSQSSPSVLKRLLSRSNVNKSKSSLAASSSSLNPSSASSSSSSSRQISRSETGVSSSSEKFHIICLGDTVESLDERERSSTYADLSEQAL